MLITWRPATWNDIEPSLSIQPTNRGDALPGVKAALEAWKHLFHDPFFASAVLESTPALRGHRLIGFGAAVLVNFKFVDAEVANPRPDITSRIIASIQSGQSVLATRKEVAQANAREGVDVVILYCAWRDDILSPQQRHEVEVLLATSLAEILEGFRIRRILVETTSESVTAFHRRSTEYQVIADFPVSGRVIHLMTEKSATALPGSLGNIIFRFRQPVLRLRDSDQQLLSAALAGTTDKELASQLGITFSAVKARWRSIFAQVGAVMPGLVGPVEDLERRGAQKRNRVLAYVRNHREELRPYDWGAKTRKSNGLGENDDRLKKQHRENIRSKSTRSVVATVAVAAGPPRKWVNHRSANFLFSIRISSLELFSNVHSTFSPLRVLRSDRLALRSPLSRATFLENKHMTPRQVRRAAERNAKKQARKAENVASPMEADPNTGEACLAQLPESSTISPAQLAANRANAQFSTGPTSDTGKAKSSLNAVKTGLTGRTVLLPAEDAAEYEHHIRAYEKELQPVGQIEADLVRSIANTTWRLKRIPALEMAIFAQGSLEFADSFKEHDLSLRPAMMELQTFMKYEKQLRNLQLQEARLARRREKETAELRKLQSERLAQQMQALDCAAMSYLAAKQRDPSFDPAANGFEFSIAEIERYLERVPPSKIARFAIPHERQTAAQAA